jgi:hypothetical protein
MSIAEDLARALRLPLQVPLHLGRIELEVIYTAEAVAEGLPAERAGEMAIVAGHLTYLLRAGFLCRPAGPDPSAVLSVAQTTPDRVLVGYAGRGAHVNLLVLMLRLIWGYHQSPPDAFDSLVMALGSEKEARELFRDLQFRRLIALVTARQLVALPGAAMRDAPDAMRGLSQDMPAPGTGRLSDSPVIEAESLKVQPFIDPPDEDMEDAWLSAAQVPLFLPPGFDPEFEEGEEYFVEAKGRKSLKIEEISVEQVFLFEFLNVLSGGRIGQLAVTAP